tara:strand:+ start:99 stop:341 length:243 start_codon:yes stop_codon:yes gene_type:complete
MKISLTKKEIDVLADCIEIERTEVYYWTLKYDSDGNPFPKENRKINIERYKILNNLMKKLGNPPDTFPELSIGRETGLIK